MSLVSGGVITGNSPADIRLEIRIASGAVEIKDLDDLWTELTLLAAIRMFILKPVAI